MHTKRRARELLADNVNAAVDEGKTTHRGLVALGAVTNGLLGDLRNARRNVGIDALDALADALGVEAWQLIHPDPGSAKLSPEAYHAALALDAIQDPEKRRDAFEIWDLIVRRNGRPPPEFPGDEIEMPEQIGIDRPAKSRP